MGLFDKFLDAVRLNDDYDEDDDDFFDEDDDLDEEEAAPKKPSRFFSKFGSKSKAEEEEDDFEDEPAPAPRKAEAKPAPAASSSAKYGSAKQPSSAASRPASTRTAASRPAASSSQKVTPMRHSKGTMVSSSSGMEVCVIKPTRVEDYREIADTLLSGCTVVLNLEGIDVELAQRIIDFASGSCYAINGGLQKVSSYIFIMTPADVEISGDIQDLLGGAMPSMRTSF